MFSAGRFIWSTEIEILPVNILSDSEDADNTVFLSDDAQAIKHVLDNRLRYHGTVCFCAFEVQGASSRLAGVCARIHLLGLLIRVDQ